MPRWLFYTFLTMLLWGGWGLVSKPLSNAMSPWQVQALSSLGLLPVLVPLVLSRHFQTGSNRRRGFVYGFIAGLAGSAGNVACYQAMAAGGQAAAVIPLTSLYPLVTIVLARVVLRERLNPIQFCGIGISLLALFVLNVGGDSAWLTPWPASQRTWYSRMGVPATSIIGLGRSLVRGRRRSPSPPAMIRAYMASFGSDGAVPARASSLREMVRYRRAGPSRASG